MARYQHLNPLDYAFFVNDEVRRRLGLPGVNIQLVLELHGPLDIHGFKHALTALHQVYPATASRLVRSPLTGRPRWRLDHQLPNAAQAVQVRSLQPATPQQLHHQCERVLRSPLDAAKRPPLQFCLFRGLAAGDALLMRWPHALMDARGGAIVLEELQRLYEEEPDPRSLSSAGDELRDDLGRLIADLSNLKRTKSLFGSAQAAPPPNWQDARLSQGPVVADGRGLRYTVRCLSPQQTQRLRDAALRVCGFARLSDFVRACAIQALHRVVPRPQPARAGYSTMQLVDNRKRRRRTPVCRNFFSALPIYVPAEVASDLRATADLITESTARMLSSGLIARRFAALERMSHLPVSLLARILQYSLTSGKPTLFGRGLGGAPSLPMGFMGSFSRPMPTFCGARLLNVYGVGAILPHEGFALNLNTPNDRGQLNIAATYFEPHVTAQVMNSFLDHFVAALLDPT